MPAVASHSPSPVAVERDPLATLGATMMENGLCLQRHEKKKLISLPLLLPLPLPLTPASVSPSLPPPTTHPFSRNLSPLYPSLSPPCPSSGCLCKPGILKAQELATAATVVFGSWGSHAAVFGDKLRSQANGTRHRTSVHTRSKMLPTLFERTAY